MQVPDEVFASGLLDKAYHDRLLADLTKVVEVAGIPAKFVWTKLSSFCGKEEIAWLRTLRSSEQDGLAYTGKLNNPVEDKMMAMVGACLRNYIDARLMSVQDVIQLTKDGDMPSPTVLLIPNFCVDKAEGGDIAQWQTSSLLGLLYTRASKGQKTVLYASSLAALEKNYGRPFRDTVEAHYLVL